MRGGRERDTPAIGERDGKNGCEETPLIRNCRIAFEKCALKII